MSDIPHDSQSLAQRVLALEAELANVRQREKDLQTLIENSQDLLYRTDINGFITYVSPSVFKISGYTVEEAIGMHLASEVYVHAEEREIFLNELRIKGEVNNYLARLKRKDGSTWWAAANAHFHTDQAGVIRGVEGITRDVTRMVETDMELQQIFSLSLDLICVAELATATFTKVNPAFTHVLGFSEEELMGQTFISFLHPDDIDSTVQVVEEKLKLGAKVINFRNRFRTKDGHYRWLNWVSHPVPEIGMTYAIAHDVTDEMLAAEALQASEKKFRTIIESSPMGVHLYELTPDNRLLFTGANKAADTILGITHDQMIGLTLQEAFPALCDTEIPDIYRSICTVGRCWRNEQVKYQDNRISGAFEIHAFQTSPGNMAVFFLDITNRKQIEEERQYLQEQLLQAQKMKAIGTLAGGIAHDFNNLLMGILGRVSLVRTDDSISATADEHLKNVEEYIKSATDLTRQLLGFARGGKYENAPIRVNDLVKKSSEMFGRTRKEITIHKHLPDDIWNIEGDSQQLHHVLLNLYMNAWQAMPEGGQLFLRTENVIVGESYARALETTPGRYVKISVADTGIGMDEATRQKIFEPFFTTKDKSRGTGLGLASVYGIVKNHSGFIQVTSSQMEGATFDIYLPTSEKVVKEQKESIPKIERGTGTILLVDDESMALEVGREMLRSLGYDVRCAANGNEAVAMFSEHWRDIDLVILDMIMPGLDGSMTFDLLKEIQPEVRVLLASGYSIDGKAADILSRGCQGFIQKPFSLTALSTKIKEMLC